MAKATCSRLCFVIVAYVGLSVTHTKKKKRNQGLRYTDPQSALVVFVLLPVDTWGRIVLCLLLTQLRVDTIG